MKDWIIEQVKGLMIITAIFTAAGTLEWITFWLLGVD